MILIYIRVKLNLKPAPMTLKEITWRDRLVSLKGAWGIGMLALIAIGGIYAGIFTPTEAGALSAFGAFFTRPDHKTADQVKWYGSHDGEHEDHSHDHADYRYGNGLWDFPRV